jgi:hypothetical protein
MTKDSDSILTNAVNSITARQNALLTAHLLNKDNERPAIELLQELSMWRALAEFAINDLQIAATNKRQTDTLFDGMTALLNTILPTYKMGKGYQDTQRAKASGHRTKDALAALMERTYRALRKSRSSAIRPQLLIDNLGKHDSADVLRAVTATNHLGKPSDPKRSYTKGRGANTIIFWEQNGTPQRTNYKALVERLKTIKRHVDG